MDQKFHGDDKHGVDELMNYNGILSIEIFMLMTIVCNPGALFQNRNYGAGRPQNQDPVARTGITVV
jgi:hypothetical protein